MCSSDNIHTHPEEGYWKFQGGGEGSYIHTREEGRAFKQEGYKGDLMCRFKENYSSQVFVRIMCTVIRE